MKIFNEEMFTLEDVQRDAWQVFCKRIKDKARRQPPGWEGAIVFDDVFDFQKYIESSQPSVKSPKHDNEIAEAGSAFKAAGGSKFVDHLIIYIPAKRGVELLNFTEVEVDIKKAKAYLGDMELSLPDYYYTKRG